jgi:kanamycin kinase
VDVDDFDDPERNPTELLAWLQTHIPDHEDLVFTHGDYCLPNVLIDPAARQISGYIDWGRAGVADRYQDLAIGARSVRYNLGAEWEPRFLAAYGLDTLDLERLAWYETLDELF